MSGFISVLLFATLIFMVVMVISSQASGGEPEFFGHRMMTVLSGSMEPEFMTGSIIAVKYLDTEEARELEEGQIITFMTDSDNLVTHRIMEREEAGGQVLYRTQGDNNENRDSQPVFSENVRAVYSDITIPYAGYVADYARSTVGIVLMIIIPGVALLIYAGISIYSVGRELENRTKKKPEQPTQTNGST